MSAPSVAAAQPAAGATARLFIALWPDGEARAALASCRDRFDWPAPARPVMTVNLHLTLHFLGNQPLQRIAAIADAAQVPAVGFDLRLERIECWAGGLTVLRPLRAPTALLRLHAALADRLRLAGLPVEPRRLRPHVTLARRNIHCTPGLLDRPIDWRVMGHVLVQSMPDGSYRVLKAFC